MKFNLTEGVRTLFDAEGIDVEDRDHARSLAVAAAREIMGAQISEGYLDTNARIDVLDGDDSIVVSIPFSDVFRHGHA